MMKIISSLVILSLIAISGWAGFRYLTRADVKSRHEGDYAGHVTPVSWSKEDKILSPPQLNKEKTEGSGVKFIDATHGSGIRFEHEQSEDMITAVTEVMGSGACFIDYDNDGYVDIFAVNGSGFTYFYGGNPWWHKPPTSRLFHNNGDGTFTDVSEKSGLAKTTWGMGCTVGDFNNDGYDDIYLTNYGPNILYKNNGDGTFTHVTKTAGVAGSWDNKWSTSAAWGDYDNDGRLDLYVLNYIKFDKYMNPAEPNSSFSSFAPLFLNTKVYTSAPNILFHNNGDGTFTDVTKASGVEDSAGKGLGVIFSDVDNDGKVDIYVINEGLRNVLFKNLGNGRFKDIGGEAGVDSPLSGMGVAVGDYDNDGDMDIFSTYPSSETNILYRNKLIEGGISKVSLASNKLRFEDVTVRSGLGEDVSIGYFGWGTELFDYDNDGFLDIFVANGNPVPDFDNPRGTVGQSNQIFRNNNDMTFTDVSSISGDGMKIVASSRGAAFGDIDNDGDIDIFINNNNDYANLLKNIGGNSNNWLNIKLVGTKSNRDGIGARVSIKTGDLTQIREVKSSSSYLSQNDMRLNFGMGNEKKVDYLNIRWPSRVSQIFKDINANQFITITEGKDEITINQFTNKDKDLPLPAPGYKKIEARKTLRYEVIRILGEIRDKRAVTSLLKLLKDKDPLIRKEAVIALGKIGDIAAINPLIQCLKEDREVIEETVSALRYFDSDTIIEPLIGALDDQDKGVRLETISTMGHLLKEEQDIFRATNFKKRLFISPLIKRLGDQDDQIRGEAVRALGHSESYRAVMPIINMLSDENRDVRREGVIALGHLRDKRAIEPLIAILKDNNAEEGLRASAVISLIRLESETTVEPLLELLKDSDERIKLKGISVLHLLLLNEEAVLFNKKRITGKIIELLDDRNKEIRLKAIEMLGLIKDNDPNITDHLLKMLKDSNKDIKRKVVDLSGIIKERRVLEDLIKMALNKDEEEDIRISALRSSLQIYPSIDIKRLYPLIEEENNGIRKAAIRYLGSIGDKGLMDILLKYSSDPDIEIKKEAIIALGGYHENKVIDGLVKLIKIRDDPSVRSAAIHSLTRIGDKKGVFPVSGIARNRKDEVRLEAIRGLGSFNNQDAFGYLKEIIDDKTEDKEARTEALKGLDSFKGNEVIINYLEGLIKKRGEDKDLRLTAISLLSGIDKERVVKSLIGMLYFNSSKM